MELLNMNDMQMSRCANMLINAQNDKVCDATEDDSSKGDDGKAKFTQRRSEHKAKQLKQKPYHLPSINCHLLTLPQINISIVSDIQRSGFTMNASIGSNNGVV